MTGAMIMVNSGAGGSSVAGGASIASGMVAITGIGARSAYAHMLGMNAIDAVTAACGISGDSAGAPAVQAVTVR